MLREISGVRQIEDEPRRRYKATPILVAGGSFDAGNVAAVFLGHSGAVDQKSSDFIYHKLLGYPDG